MVYSNIPHNTELSLPTEWDHDNELMNNYDEEVSATSHEEACKVLEQWQADQDEDLDIMEVDEQIGSNLLGDDIFGAPCLSPSGPLEELVYMNIDEDVRFLAPLIDSAADADECIGSVVDAAPSTSSSTCSLPFEERYQVSLRKLEESMRRSQETRKSLFMKTTKTEKYSRTKSVSGVISSIEKSSYQLQHYLTSIQRQI